ncbi:Na+/H+ antiporter NhaC family protein [Streptomyces sp. NPDC047000]|uniref:Na+/H+ antiporter NhaC family protein n=1 Tax=Streptomyces sp. NPDC047000 TaxID=3155474 RepID=UPI0033EF20C3
MASDNVVDSTTTAPTPAGDAPAPEVPTPTGWRRLASRRDQCAYGLLLIALVVTALAGTDVHGAWSLLPPVMLFVFVLITQRVVEGFVWGSALAVFMTHGWGFMTTYNDTLFKQLTNHDNLWLIITLLSIGGLVAVLERSGLSARFGEWVAGLAKTGRAASITTLLASLFLSQDGYLSISTTGAAMSGANERVGRSRLFTAYLIRTGAIPGSAFNPLATGSVFVAGLLVINGHVKAGDEVAGYAQLIPFMFYPMAALLVGFLAAVGVIPPLGAMRRHMTVDPAEAEAEQTVGEGRRPRLINFFLALALLVTFTLWTGSIQISLLITLALAAVAFVAQKLFTPEGYLDTVIEGMKDMLSLALIMSLAFVFVAALDDLGFTKFVVSRVSGNVPAALLPVLIFVLFGITEFLVTLNWSLYLLALPVVIPLAQQADANPNLVIAALISAGLWGATSCITSDVGLLNTFTTRTKVFQHWLTNLPYQAIAWVLAAVAYLVAGVVMA